MRAITRAGLYHWLAVQSVRPDHVDHELRFRRQGVQVIVLEFCHFDALRDC